MTAGWIATLITGIAGLTGLITFFVGRHDRQKDPLPKQAAEVAIAKDALGVVKGSYDFLIDDVARLREDLDAVRGEASTLRQEVQLLRREVQSIRSAWAMWYRDLADRWTLHREQPTPPVPPTTD